MMRGLVCGEDRPVFMLLRFVIVFKDGGEAHEVGMVAGESAVVLPKAFQLSGGSGLFVRVPVDPGDFLQKGRSFFRATTPSFRCGSRVV